MGITYDDYIRTSGASPHWGRPEAGSNCSTTATPSITSTYTGQYSVGEEMFVDGPPGTIGPDGKPTETVTEENYFFRLSNYQKKLIDLIESKLNSLSSPRVHQERSPQFPSGYRGRSR